MLPTLYKFSNYKFDGIRVYTNLPVLGAIANAIYDACGVRITELPITPEKILSGLKELWDH